MKDWFLIQEKAMCIKNELTADNYVNCQFLFGPSDRIRTCGILLPNVLIAWTTGTL